MSESIGMSTDVGIRREAEADATSRELGRVHIQRFGLKFTHRLSECLGWVVVPILWVEMATQ